MRILTLSWEYPPIVEGGLARHVRKLVRAARARRPRGPRRHARRRAPGGASRTATACIVHRVREPEFPKDDLDAFIAWVDHMNEDMLRRGRRARRAASTSCTRTTGSSPPRRARWPAGAGVPWLVTVHATEYGRHQGWVDKHPQSHIHGVERRMVRARRPRDHVLALHARAGRRRLRRPRARRSPRSRTGSTRPTCSPSPTCRGCARSSPRRTRSSCCSSAGSSTRRASTSRSTRCRG